MLVQIFITDIAGDPLIGAHVYVNGGNNPIGYADSQGIAEVELSDTGVHRLEVSFIGHTPSQIDVGEGVSAVTVNLAPNSTELGEATVTGTAPTKSKYKFFIISAVVIALAYLVSRLD
tara:strand:- start:15740 stop:16093 length:354 start_codon:yes stop_codon:yes gene_type:complete